MKRRIPATPRVPALPRLSGITGMFLLIFGGLAGAQVTWTGASTVTNLWSDTNNWSTFAVPMSADDVVFSDTLGFTNTAGAVNNVVDANTSIKSLSYTVISNSVQAKFHTTRIEPGMTLTTSDPTAGTTIPLYMSAVVGIDDLGFVAVKGDGGANLVVGNPAAPSGEHMIVQYEPASGSGTCRAILDLSELDTFNLGGATLRVGNAAGTVSASHNGTLLLARSNFINLAGPYAALTYAGLLIGTHNSTGVAADNRGDLQLGISNTVWADAVKIGCIRKCTGTMEFQSAALAFSPTLTLRGLNGGTSRVTYFGIGDDDESAVNISTSELCTGVVDLSGGTLDALVADMVVGRNSSSSTSTARGTGFGTLTFDAGTLDVNQLLIGWQSRNNRGNATGAVNVRGDATVLAGTIYMGRDQGSASGTGTAELNIEGGSVKVSALVDGRRGGSSTINLGPGSLLDVAGVVNVYTLNLANGVLTNATLLTASVSGSGTIHAPVQVPSGAALTPGWSIGALTISNSLTLDAGSTSTFEVNLDTLACDSVIGLNNVAYGGTLTVINLGGLGAATNGANFKLFSALSYSGAFATTNLPALGTDLVWDTSGLTNSGTLKIVSPVSTVSTNITWQVTGTTLNLSWPPDHKGWKLQVQTNSAAVGLSTNWFVVPGSENVYQMTFPIDPANGSVFYRLVY